MMRVAQSIAQKIIFTSDNNRFEEFALIAADALKGNELKNTIEDKISPNPYSELYQRGMQNKPKIE